MQYLARDYARVREMLAEGRRQDEAMIEVAGCTDAELGAALAARWDFPEGLVAVIGTHWYSPLGEEFVTEKATTICADALAATLEIGQGVDRRVPVARREVWQAAGVAAEDMGRVTDEVLAEMEKSRSFIELLYR